MNTTSTPEEKLAAAIALAKVASEMADRLKSLFETESLALFPILKDKIDPNCDGMILRKSASTLSVINYLAEYFDATDAVDFEEDDKWQNIVAVSVGTLGINH